MTIYQMNLRLDVMAETWRRVCAQGERNACLEDIELEKLQAAANGDDIAVKYLGWAAKSIRARGAK